MEQKKDLISKFKRGVGKLRDQGLILTLRHYLLRAGIQITPFYYLKEVRSSDIPVGLTVLPEGFEFSVFGHDEVAAISKLPERKGYMHELDVIENFNKGDTCLGIKYKGEIVAFTWSSLDKSRSKFYPATMKANETYLFDMYVLKAFRGQNLAPILRYKSYELLKGMGRDTFYSITVTSNTASLKVKQKLNAQTVLLAVYFDLFNKWRWRWVVRRY